MLLWPHWRIARLYQREPRRAADQAVLRRAAGAVPEGAAGARGGDRDWHPGGHRGPLLAAADLGPRELEPCATRDVHLGVTLGEGNAPHVLPIAVASCR